MAKRLFGSWPPCSLNGSISHSLIQSFALLRKSFKVDFEVANGGKEFETQIKTAFCGCCDQAQRGGICPKTINSGKKGQNQNWMPSSIKSERLFCRIKEMRRIATRFEKSAEIFRAMIHAALIRNCIKSIFQARPNSLGS